MSISSQVQMLESDGFLGYTNAQNRIKGVFEVGQIGQYDANDPTRPKVHAEQIGETNFIGVSVEASDPWTAGRIAETVPKVYNEWLLENRQSNLTKALDFLTARQTRYSNEYNNSIKAFQNFKSTRKLPALGTGEAGERANLVAQTEQSETHAELDVAAATTRLTSLRKERTALPNADHTKVVRNNDPEIEIQKKELADLEAQRESLLTKWKEGTPDVNQIEAQIAAQKTRLEAIPKTVTEDDKTDRHPQMLELDDKIRDAEVSVQTSRVELEKAREASGKAVTNLKDYSALEPQQVTLAQAAADTKTQLDSTNRMVEELQLERSALTDSVTLRSGPSSPEKVRPVIPQYIAVAVLMSIVLGVGLALIKDHIEDRVSSPQDVFQICGLEPLAQMPSLPATTALASTAIARHEANPALFDSYRLLRFNLLNAAERGYMGSLVVTSVTGSEGKTDLACDLAEVMAAGGRRIILVDANLRNPSLAGHFGVSERPGLTDILVGDATLAQALAPSGIEGLMVLPAGARTPNPVDLLESSQMVSLHSELREHADLIIFDAPSCLAYADVSVLSSFTDSVLVVAELGSTKRDLLNRGVQMLQRSSARLVGVVLRDKQLPRRTKRGKAAA